MNDRTNGYDGLAEVFGRGRSHSPVGASEVRGWASSLRPGADVLDVGCGVGVPITQALVDAACRVHALDASPRMVEQFKARFPNLPVRCETVETMTHFGRVFDGVVAWGLVFLLPPEAQAAAIARLAGAVAAGGELLFTAPRQVGQWKDALTGRDSYALGVDVYRRLIESAGLTLVRELDDEGDNHYYQARRSPPLCCADIAATATAAARGGG